MRLGTDEPSSLAPLFDIRDSCRRLLRVFIGDAVGATFYLEPVATLDVDVFIAFRPEEGQLLISPQPIFAYLKTRGATMQGEYIVVAGWPVQFLPPGTPLVEEALKEYTSTVMGRRLKMVAQLSRRTRPLE